MSLLRSEVAGLASLALEQLGAVSLSDVAHALEVEVSSAQRALGLLIEEGAVRREDRRYRLAEGAVVEALLVLAANRKPLDQVIRTVLCASPAVEFAGRDQAGWLVVTTWTAEPRDLVTLRRALRRFSAGAPNVFLIDHDELRDRLLDDPSFRERAEKTQVHKGRVMRSFPDRVRHGSPSARRLGHLNPDIPRPSQRRLHDLVRRFGLNRVTVFGSAVREDLRADSDIDVLVEHRPGVERSLTSETDLRRALEALFDRDVDVVEPTTLRPDIRERAEQEGVVIYG